MKDILSKRERVERTLSFLPVDRIAIHDHILNPEVISLYAGKRVEGFGYSLDDVCEATRKTLDMCRFPLIPLGIDRTTTEDGFVRQNDNWTSWIVERPFDDTRGLKGYCLRDIEKMKALKFDPEREREIYREKFLRIQKLVDETVIMDTMEAGLEKCWTTAGMELFTFLYYEEPEVIRSWLRTFLEYQLKTIHAVADNELSPVVLIVNEMASPRAPLFSPDFFRENLFPEVKRLTDAWHEYGVKVLVEIQGNCKGLIEDFLRCGVDGFYAIEPIAGMDIVELKKKYPKMVWACGVDGIALMERGTPDEVRKEVRRQVYETDALNTGGLFLGTSSEVNPSIKVENYKAMIEEATSIYNENFIAGFLALN